jgi:outer membrane biosynthesis protein TonB
MEFKKEDNENDIHWQKEQEQDKKNFDFAAFLGSEGLDDRVTDVMDGQDLLEPDAFDHISPDYVPRRPTDGEHGRHEAPSSQEDFEKEPAPQAPERPTMDPADPRYAAPERPRVVVADPHPKKVYVSPVGDDYESSSVSGGGGGKKGLVSAIVVLGIIAVVLLTFLSSAFGGSSDDDEAEATPKPTSPAAATDAPQATNSSAAAATAAPAKRTYTITVTAGSGGSISPSGAVTVEEGGSVTFAIVPNGGYVISQLLVDGTAVATQDSYTFTNVTAGHTIYAVFQADVTATPAPTATPTPSPAPTAEPTPDPTEPPPIDEPTEPDPVTEPDPPAEAAELAE